MLKEIFQWQVVIVDTVMVLLVNGPVDRPDISASCVIDGERSILGLLHKKLNRLSVGGLVSKEYNGRSEGKVVWILNGYLIIDLKGDIAVKNR